MITPKKEPSFVLKRLRPPGCKDCDENYDPYGVFNQLFDFTSLDQIKSDLWEMFKMANQNPECLELNPTLDGFAFTYEILHDILTAAYIALKERKDAKPASSNSLN